MRRFCQRSRQTWRRKLEDEFRLRGLKDSERSGGTTEVEQAAAVGGNMLVVAGVGAEEVAELVGASAETFLPGGTFETPHGDVRGENTSGRRLVVRAGLGEIETLSGLTTNVLC